MKGEHLYTLDIVEALIQEKQSFNFYKTSINILFFCVYRGLELWVPVYCMRERLLCFCQSSKWYLLPKLCRDRPESILYTFQFGNLTLQILARGTQHTRRRFQTFKTTIKQHTPADIRKDNLHKCFSPRAVKGNIFPSWILLKSNGCNAR